MGRFGNRAGHTLSLRSNDGVVQIMVRADDSHRAVELAERLGVIVEALDDMAFDALRSAAAHGGGRPEVDKRLMQARRSVEKARHILETLGE